MAGPALAPALSGSPCARPAALLKEGSRRPQSALWASPDAEKIVRQGSQARGRTLLHCSLQGNCSTSLSLSVPIPKMDNSTSIRWLLWRPSGVILVMSLTQRWT